MSELQEVLVRRKVRVDRELINGVPRSSLPEYAIWIGMKARCRNPNAAGYRHYGARGISVCERWREDFSTFYADMGPRPSGRHSIDRIDNDGNYEPANCRWALPLVQSANKRTAALRDNPYFWSEEDLGILKRMYAQYETVETIAGVLGRSWSTCRLRIHMLHLHRDASISRLAKKHSDLAPILRAKGVPEFLNAVKIQLETERSEKHRQNDLSKVKIEETIAEVMARQCPRNEKMVALRSAGLNLSEVASLFGVSRERVRQIQLTNFSNPSGERKIYTVKPGRKLRQVDRMVRAWNASSAAARAAFLDVVEGVDAREKLSRSKP